MSVRMIVPTFRDQTSTVRDLAWGMELVDNASVVFIFQRTSVYRQIPSVKPSTPLEVTAWLVLMDIRLKMDNVFLVQLPPSPPTPTVETMMQLMMYVGNALLGFIGSMADALLFLMIVTPMTQIQDYVLVVMMDTFWEMVDVHCCRDWL